MSQLRLIYFFFFFNDTATTEIYTLSLHDALPISVPGAGQQRRVSARASRGAGRRLRRHQGRCGSHWRPGRDLRSEEHTSELQSQSNLVCRLLLEKKKNDAGFDDTTIAPYMQPPPF